jgi:chorismate mutase-like protein
MEVLKPYRARINVIDEQILQLLRRRYDVIEDVAKIKARENIPAVIHDRIEEVREKAAALAAEKGLDSDFIRKLYAQLIDHSCALEETRIGEIKAGKRRIGQV